MQIIKEYKKEYTINSATDALKFLKDFGTEDREHFVVLGLNARNQVTFREVVAIGLADQCMLHPREVFRRAIINNSVGIICAHNHPTGYLSASSEDLAVKESLTKASEILGIKILDWLIIGKNKLLSY